LTVSPFWANAAPADKDAATITLSVRIGNPIVFSSGVRKRYRAQFTPLNEGCPSGITLTVW